jgi:hypothetical protein
VIFANGAYLAIAGVVFAIISRFSRRPARVFWWVAIVVMLFSLLQLLTLEDAPNDTIAFVIAMRIVATIVVVAVFTRLAEGSSTGSSSAA